jgi:hypothetical protein
MSVIDQVCCQCFPSPFEKGNSSIIFNIILLLVAIAVTVVVKIPALIRH